MTVEVEVGESSKRKKKKGEMIDLVKNEEE